MARGFFQTRIYTEKNVHVMARSGRRSRRFKSCHLDHSKDRRLLSTVFCYTCICVNLEIADSMPTLRDEPKKIHYLWYHAIEILSYYLDAGDIDMARNLERAKAFYNQGLRFMRCAERCMGEKNADGSITIIGGKYQTLSSPVMVNAAFSCELFFKSILILCDVDYHKGHGLKYLYDLLPNEEYKNILKNNSASGKTFEDEMEKHSNDFINWRYYIETPGEYSMDPMFTFILMSDLQALTKAIIDNSM